MNLKQVRYFCETVDAGNARAAADKLFVAPTAISMQISQLEALLGGALFDRATRPMGLTPLGQFVYSKGTELLSASGRLEVEAKGMAAGRLGWLGIGFTRSTIFSILPEAVRAMQSALPDVRIDLEEILTEEQPAALRSGAIHLAIARTLGAFTREPDLHYTELFDDPLVVALPAQHPLAAQASLRAAELNALPYVSYPKVANAHFSRQVLNILEQAGAKVQVGHEAKEINTALGLVAAGLGATVVGRSVATNNRGDIRFVPIADLSVGSKVLAVRKAGPVNALVEAFLDKLREQVPGRD
ncbi:LysR family transcriptional regulator [Polaromonas sp. JS666]|uniref:LysR family transcriptional regulator n=1 Tax=Polaromonas sp. (strain JS666 / ATCC BAA-500) TaxID=296591 RepID=UPI00088E2C93|nr:LysR family transcriptional regulator [Polaromonas sp. JS666]SDM43891.1 DNA-binding transcriptional regulator, LysR family [Polaromonas sp. JS666]